MYSLPSESGCQGGDGQRSWCHDIENIAQVVKQLAILTRQ